MKDIFTKLAALLTVVLLLSTFTACFNNKMSEEERKKLETECLQRDTFNNINFLFKGFDNNEFDTILIKEYNNNAVIDSFKVIVDKAESPIDIENKSRSATVNHVMSIKNTYKIIIPGQEPYELTDMKMIMWAQFTMNSEGWGCVMGSYKLDGQQFEHDANPTFVKR